MFSPNRINRKCLICGKGFQVISYIVKIGKGKFCSRKCADINHKITFRGNKNPAWVGGRYINRGYVCVYEPNHPYAVMGKYVTEHRLVMEEYLGRYLEPEEVVHHKNGNKEDNRIENLELFNSNSEHIKEEWRTGSFANRKLS